MKEGRRNLREMKKLLKKRGKRKAEPNIELFLTKCNDIEGFLLCRHMATIHQAYRNVIRHVKTLLKLPLKNEFGRLFRMITIDAFSCPTTFLSLTSHTGRCNTPSCWHAKAMGRVRPAWHNDQTLEISHPTLLPVSNTSVVRWTTYIGPGLQLGRVLGLTCKASPNQVSP